MSNKKIIIIGSGGLSRSIVDTILEMKLEIKGVIDLEYSGKEEVVYGSRVIGNLDFLDSITIDKYSLVMAIGNPAIRKKYYTNLVKRGFSFTTIIHPKTIISNNNVTIKNGCVICAGSMIMSDVMVGENSLICTGAIVEHETQIGSHCTISPGVKIAGRVKIYDGVQIGIGASVIDKLIIGSDVIIGAGSVVLTQVQKNLIVAGVPAKIIGKNSNV